MSLFESLLILCAAALVLLQIARRLSLPYPSMLAAAGLLVAAIPGAPDIPIAPDTALALFIAPVLIDASYDFPLGAARRLMWPLIVYGVGAVLATALVVALIGRSMLGLPIAAALTLGAIVAPPDAAAATAVLGRLNIARRVDALLKGESLFNDASALLLFSAGLTLLADGAFDGRAIVHLMLAAPGGIAFGIGYGLVVRKLSPLIGTSVGGTLAQFVHAFATWIIADRLGLSAVLATVASGMTIATTAGIGDPPRMRVHSFAVWTTVVFLLNVLAFLLMGLQGRRIFGSMSPAALAHAGLFAGAVVAAVIVVRIAIAFVYRFFVVRAARKHGGPQPIAPAETLLVGWTGMRGLISMATAFALPQDFPERDVVVLTAFAVVLGTLVIQGATLVPLIRLFGIEHRAESEEELKRARRALAEAALQRLGAEDGDAAEAIRGAYRDLAASLSPGGDSYPLDRRRGLTVAAVQAQRKRLEELRASQEIGPDLYLKLQEDLDWKELAAASDEERRLEES